MAIVAFTAFRAECDLCGCEVPGDGGEPWYLSIEMAKVDLGAWEWHVEGSHVCCTGCAVWCLGCDRIHGSHAIDCDVACVDMVDDWIAALTAAAGEA